MNMSADIEMDTLGLICPLPITHTAKKIKELDEGDILAITSDDVGILVDMPAWCKGMGHEYLGYEEIEENRVYRVLVKKRTRKKGK